VAELGEEEELRAAVELGEAEELRAAVELGKAEELRAAVELGEAEELGAGAWGRRRSLGEGASAGSPTPPDAAHGRPRDEERDARGRGTRSSLSKTGITLPRISAEYSPSEDGPIPVSPNQTTEKRGPSHPIPP